MTPVILKKLVHRVVSPAWERQVAVNIVASTCGTVLGQLLQLLLIFWLARTSNLPTYAAFLSATAWVAVLEKFSDFGGRIWAVQRFCTVGDARAVLVICLQTKILFTLVAAAISLLIPSNQLGMMLMGIVLLVAFLQPDTDPLVWYLRSRERMDIEAALFVAWKTVVLLGVFVVVGCFGMGIEGILITWMAASILRIIVESRLKQVRRVFYSESRSHPSGVAFRHAIAAMLPIGAGSALLALNARMGMLSLEATGSELDVAIFGSAYIVIAAAGIFGSVITIALFPKLCRAVSAHDSGGSAILIQQSTTWIGAVYLPLCGIGMAASIWIAPFLFGENLYSTGPIMVLLWPIAYLASLNFALRMTLAAYGRNHLEILALVSGILVFMLAYRIPLHEALSLVAAAAWMLSELAVFLIKAYFVSKDCPQARSAIWSTLGIFGILVIVAVLILGGAQVHT